MLVNLTVGHFLIDEKKNNNFMLRDTIIFIEAFYLKRVT